MNHFFLRRFILVLLCFVVVLLPVSVVYAEENISHETDDNGALEKADSLQIGTMMVGRLLDKKDVDCFKVDTTATGDIIIDFQHEADSAYAYCWYMEVLNADKKVLKSGTLSGKDATNFSVSSVKPGTYYFKISAISGGNPLTNGFSDAAYRLTITTKCLSHPELTDWVVTKEYSCSQEGERAQFCVACGTPVVVEPVKKTEHSYTEWSVIEEAEFLESGKKQKVCTSCGDVVHITYHSDTTKYALIAGAALVIIIIIISIIRRSRKPSYSSYSSGKTYSSGSSVSYGGSDSNYSGGSSYSGSSTYSGGSYGGGSDEYYTRPADGLYSYGGETHNVYTSDAEGYSTAPYIEDAEGYKTYVDPASVAPPFDWNDAG